jgi:hypothetical protein
MLPLHGVPSFPARSRVDHAYQGQAVRPSRRFLRAFGKPRTRSLAADLLQGAKDAPRTTEAQSRTSPRTATSSGGHRALAAPGPDVAGPRRRPSGRRVVIPVKPVWIVPGEGNSFHCRVDAEFGHQVLQMSADGIHGEVQLLRHCATVRGALRQAG